MREKLDAWATSMIRKEADEVLRLNDLWVKRGKDLNLSEADLEMTEWILSDATDDCGPMRIGESAVVIFCCAVTLPFVKLLCMYSRHKLQKAERA